MRNLMLSLLLLTSALPAGEAAAKPFLYPLFTDHAVLQRDRPLPVWGWDAPGTTVAVTLGSAKAEAVAGADGRWLAQLPAQPAGGPHEMTIVGTRSEKRSDILLGDVWLCSGQSNMGFALKNSLGGPEAAAAANGMQLRLLTVTRQTSTTPKELPAGGAWQICTPETAATFSAIGFYFARDILPHTKTPVGLISANWFGTPAEAWTSRASLLSLPEPTADVPPADGTVTPDPKRFGDQGQNRPTALYNGMIQPLAGTALRGVLWYQGESNGYPQQAPQYRRLLPALIADWRACFADPALPFGIVQIAGWQGKQTQPVDGGWAFLREAQAQVAREVPHCGLTLTIDIGDVKDVHPRNKAEVGRRLALWARAEIYGEKNLEWSGPWLRQAAFADGAARLTFDHGKGMHSADGGPIKGFAIAGADKRWRFAEATVDGDSIVLRSPEVAAPVAARYAWAMHPVCNLINAAGLPAVPFRTDTWSN